MEWKSTVATLTLYLHNISLSGAITLSVFYLSTMARGLSWTSTEVEACAKAFVSATNNPVRGSDQRQQDFIDDILKGYLAQDLLHCLVPASYIYYALSM
jgi:hypothetical protein